LGALPLCGAPGSGPEVIDLPRQLHYLAAVIALGAILFYTLAHFIPSKTPAFIFLLIPLLSWLVVVISVLISLKKRKKFADH